MKKIALVVGMASVIALLSACSDEKSEIAEYKTSFVNNCVAASGQPAGETADAVNALCSCAYDKAIEKYGVKEFKRIDSELAKSGNIDIEAQKTMMDFVSQCAKTDR
ncbi:hypothetical protein [Providencia sneebia]|uniref:Lipoprotein n=1 Tax=Providencia sneebia DSM 19967 TaxID=1141660 RepID=K8WD76_9GAMM|nr:hypothetical protein [Providencia sneebia]EKT58593.1 lipoprotein [Providencia sneebia DSM 19967]